jgi:hypothetical protein
MNQFFLKVQKTLKNLDIWNIFFNKITPITRYEKINKYFKTKVVDGIFG